MKSIRLETPGQLGDFTMPEAARPQGGEALVRVRRIGICGTDFHAFRGRQPFFEYPRVLGHELGVEILEIGANERGLKEGDRCAVEPYLKCGRCIACRRGKPNCCESLQVLGVHTDGGMRERMLLPIDTLHLSKTLELDQLALVETLGIGSHAVSRAQLERGEDVLVIGAGPIGLAVSQFAIEVGARVCVLDLNEERLEFARRNLNVPLTLASAEASDEMVRDVFGGELPTVVFDATGNAASMMRAFEFVAHGGKLVFVGLFQGDVTFPDPLFHRREMTLLSSRNSTPHDFTRIIALMESGRLDTTPWITHRADFADTVEQFPVWLQPENGVVKAMLSLDE